jgi:hypothetical protein
MSDPTPAIPAPNDALASIPDPTHVRWLIGVRYAEIAVLKRLLRAAESRNRLLSRSLARQGTPEPAHA